MGESLKTLSELIEKIEGYRPDSEAEEKEKEQMLAFMRKNPDCLLRSNPAAHLTASAWVVNPRRTAVVMAYHRIYHSWAWLGGHADGEADLLKVALKEAEEEAGLKHVRPVTEEIFSLESLTVDGHVKKGLWVPSHLHFNVTYLLEAGEDEKLCKKADENTGVGWFSFAEAIAASEEPWMVEHVYKKLIRKTEKIREGVSDENPEQGERKENERFGKDMPYCGGAGGSRPV